MPRSIWLRVAHQKYPSRFFCSIEAAFVVVDQRPCRSEVAAAQHLLDDLGTVSASRLDRARQRVAAERAEADLAQLGLLARRSGMRSSSTMIQHAVALAPPGARRRSRAAPRQVLAVHVEPHVELGPVAEREDADRLSLGDLAVEEVPQLGRWFFGSHWWKRSRKLNTRSLARLFSSSRRAPPKAASKPPAFSACFSPSVFITCVCRCVPCRTG
jgi:hypothetical protein